MTHARRLFETAPKEIYLQVGEKAGIDIDFSECDREFITWSEDRINNNDIRYVREIDPDKTAVISKEDADFIWSLLPGWVKDNGTEADAHDPMLFGTLSREGDIKVTERVKSILFKSQGK